MSNFYIFITSKRSDSLPRFFRGDIFELLVIAKFLLKKCNSKKFKDFSLHCIALRNNGKISNYFAATLQIIPLTSSATNKAPSCATATPTGLP